MQTAIWSEPEEGISTAKVEGQRRQLQEAPRFWLQARHRLSGGFARLGTNYGVANLESRQVELNEREPNPPSLASTVTVCSSRLSSLVTKARRMRSDPEKLQGEM